LIRTAQVKEEIPELLMILERIKPKVVIEMGTADSGSLFLFTHGASEDAAN